MSKKMLPLFFVFIGCLASGIYLILHRDSPAPPSNYRNQLANPEVLNFFNAKAASPAGFKLLAYFNAESFKKLKNNEPIKEWTSLGLHPITLEVISSATHPVYKKGSTNERPVVYFNGETYFEAPEVLGTDLIDANNTSLLIVFKPDAEDNPKDLTELFSWGDCDQRRFFAHLGKSMINFHYGRPTDRVDSTSVKIRTDRFNVLGLERRNNSSIIKFNGFKVGEVSNEANLDLYMTGPLIVGSSACQHRFKGAISEFMVYKNLTADEENGLLKRISEDYKLIF